MTRATGPKRKNFVEDNLTRYWPLRITSSMEVRQGFMHDRECGRSAVDDILRGKAVAAGPTEDQPPHFVENALLIRAVDYLENIGPFHIERQMLDGGSGARGIVIGWKNYGPSHAYNVANIQGDVYWLDGEKDIVATDHPHPRHVSFDLYRTA
jgi:hypothetical protein